LGRAAQLISTDIVKHLSVKHISFPSTQSTTITSTANTNVPPDTNTTNTEIDTSTTKMANLNIDKFDNPFVATAFTLEQAVWFVVSSMFFYFFIFFYFIFI
jgi:hypothetical protein